MFEKIQLFENAKIYCEVVSIPSPNNFFQISFVDFGMRHAKSFFEHIQRDFLKIDMFTTFSDGNYM